MKTRRVAFYGKGGIGKSTIASNVSALLAMQGKKVLHIGCDPKADSTRLLCKERIKTVLEVLEEKDYPERDDLVYRSESGVWCVESGGPEAGNGCAGMGIITAMKELERLGVLEEDWDVIIYDVLGDVVCGGFSVPMRQGYVDRVYIVSSADFMSLYAANNILKGVVSYSDERNLLGGLVFNHIREQEEECIAEEFTNRVKGRMAAIIRESKELKLADFRKEIYTQNMSASDSENWKAFCRLSENICRTDERSVSISQNKAEEALPIPLNVDEIEKFGMELSRKLDKL
ncbi:nitrogenase iron protein [Ruminococcus sp. AM44-9AT]|nr:AAA family ATPase [Blautia sp.]RHS75980.1 nitrogenase iron protein [Ruminococcus sp. AM44-9AT]